MESSDYRIGVDLGGTKIEAVLLDRSGKVLVREREATPKDNGYHAILNAVASRIRLLIKDTNGVVSIGIGTPGSISPGTGLIRNSNTQCLNGKALKEDLERLVGQTIKIENDANCFAMAEAKYGAGVGYDTVFGIIMGTGVGAGIVIDQKIHKGLNQIAGEWGHSILFPDGSNKCYCGKTGCVETYISGPALENQWFLLTQKHQSIKDILANSSTDSEIAFKDWKEQFITNFSISVSNVINILDPDVVILGGGVSNVPFLYNEGKSGVYSKVFSDNVKTPILRNKLGDSAGVIGAALL